MDPFSESEWFDDDPPADSLPSASPSSAEEHANPLAPSAPAPAVSMAGRLAARWPVCLAGVLIAMLAAGLLSGVNSTQPQAPAPDRAHRHDRHRPRRRRVNHQRSAGKLARVSVATPAPKLDAGSSTTSDKPPNPVAPRPTRVGPVGTERPTSPVHVGKMEQTQFDYLGR